MGTEALLFRALFFVNTYKINVYDFIFRYDFCKTCL